MRSRPAARRLLGFLLRSAVILLPALALVALTEPARTSAQPARNGSSPRKAFLPRTPALERLISDGKVVLLDSYGAAEETRLLISGSSDVLIAAGIASSSARPVRDEILLRRRVIDTSARSIPRLPRRPHVAIVQFHGPVKRSWVASLARASGRQPLAYIPHNAYLVWLDDGERLSNRSGEMPLQWTEELLPSDRLSPDLPDAGDPVTVSIQIARAGRHDEVIADVLSRAREVLSAPESFGALTHVRATVPVEALEDLASHPEVIWIEPFETPRMHDELSALISAGLVSGDSPARPGYLSWLESRDLDDLSDIIVDVADSGIDSGGTDVVHPGLKGRIAYAFNWTSEGTLQDCAGHGTHVAGTIAGSADPGAALRDPKGYLSGLGVVPSLRLGSSRIFRCDANFDALISFTELASSAYSHGARISNNSWGTRGPQYNIVCAEYDALVRDTNRDPRDGDQPFLPVFSAGNLGPLPRSIGWPATAKNVLTVGATEGVRIEGKDGCGTEDNQADSANHLLTGSSRGPTGDGRRKPDILAPGSHIHSLASMAPDYNGRAICDPFYPPGQQVLSRSTGTSHSAPHVTAAAAIVFSVFRKLTGQEPSPAMLKAILLNHAHNLTETPTNVLARPNNDQGWGRLDFGSFVDEKARAFSDQETIFTATGQESVFAPVVVADPLRRVIVTLVWTDAPGAPGANAWVNDLDLQVQAGAATYLGNAIKDGVSFVGGEADERNNVEMVILPAGQTQLNVKVLAANIAGDGLPSVPGETDQDFALYISNARLAGPRGIVSLSPPHASCGATLTVDVADAALAGAGTMAVFVDSGSDRETVRLQETLPLSGIFSGVLDVSEAAVPAVHDNGSLQTAEGASVSAFYARTGPDGQPLTRSASVTSICAPLTIADFHVERSGQRDVTIAWRTNRPADSTLMFGPGNDRSQVAADPKRVTEHVIPLTLPLQCTFHTAVARSTDASGRTAETATPLRFSTGPQGRRVVFRDDMEGLATRWTHAPARPGAADNWELGFPAVEPRGAFSGVRAWATRLNGAYDVGSDAVLVSPPIDLRDAVRSGLTFRHVYDIAGGSPPTSENDGGWLEVSSDGGTTWTRVEPPSGYPDRVDAENPYLSPDERVYAGSLTVWSTETFDLSAYDGNVIRVRFHFWQDANEPEPRGSGWSIDDVEVTAESSCHSGRLHIDAQEYGCTSSVAIELFDTNLALNPTALDTATVTARTPAGTLPLILTETGQSTAAFRGSFRLSPTAGAGVLQASQGDPLTVRYEDLDSGGGFPGLVIASGVVVDCEPPPVPDGVTVHDADDGSLLVSWDPVQASDLEGYRVHYDTDGPGPTYQGLGALQGSSPVRLETASTSLALAALGQCAPHFIAVTAFDRYANESAFSLEQLAIPARDTPCALGRITAPASSPGCNEIITLSVADSNADPNPTTPGGIILTASATAPGSTPVVVSLSETTPASGLFNGVLALAAVPSPGKLTVMHDDEVTLAYADADDGTGRPRSVTRMLGVSDCAAPIITGLAAIGRGSDRALIRWTTNEPADSRVDYGPDASLGLTASDPRLVLQHEIAILGFNPCSPVHYAVSSTDARGNANRQDDAGQPFYLGTFRDVPLFDDDFETGSAGWTHAKLSGPPEAPDEWELGAPAGDGVNAPSSAFSGSAVWGTDLDGRYERGHDIVLTSPPIAIPDVEASTLSFRHWYDISTVGAPHGFDDGAFVEMSDDGGASWSLIEPFGGYPDVIGPNAYIGFGAGVYAGATLGWKEARFPLDGLGGRTIRLRFHLLQDTNDPTHVPGFGWYIDDVAITVARPCHDAIIEMDRSAYVCNDSIAVRIEDNDLDQDPLTPDQTTSLLITDADPEGEVIALTESGPSTGLFDGSIDLSGVDAPGILAAAEGDTISARYDDADDGTGTPRTRTAHATVIECAAPVIEDVRVVKISPDSFRVAWTTTELSDSRVLYGTDPSLPLQIVDDTPTNEHEMTVAGLASCALHFFTVASRDASGNMARDDTTSGVRSLHTSDALPALEEDFAGTAPGWRSRGQGDLWRIAAGRASHASAAVYPRPGGTSPNSDFVLESPRFNIAGLAEPILTLTHSYDFPLTGGGGDGGRVEGWNGTAWVPLTPVGGYPGAVDREASPTGIPLQAFSGPTSGTITSVFDLTPLIHGDSGATRVRFRVFVDAGVGPTGAGWRIESATVTGELLCREGRLVFDRDDATCADDAVGVTLHDDDLDTDPSVSQSFVLMVDSTGGPAPLAVELLERGPASGRFDGIVPISAAGVPGTLRAAAGDVITARYDDADDGTGTLHPVIASLQALPCAGPALRGINAMPESGRVRVRWTTDVPATSEVTLTPTGGGAPIAASSLRLVTGHDVDLPVGTACGSWSVALASEDVRGLRSTASGNDLIVESVEERTHFFDNMEGADPGWTSTGSHNSWERGIPVKGPAFAFSGQRVFGTDLDENYAPGTNATLVTPLIDLRTATSPRLTFWQWYDIFASEPPNSFDDAAWVEVLPEGSNTSVYIVPMEGYSDVTDTEVGPPLGEGSPVFAGFSNTWEKTTFDLSPFAGKTIRLRFRIWQDLVEIQVNRITGAGWSLDDVRVTSSRFCHPPPLIVSMPHQTLRQGESVGSVTITGSGFREGLRVLPGTGMTAAGTQVISATQVRFDLSADPLATLGPRDIVLMNADGQAASLPDAIDVRFGTARADINGSGRIDGADLAILAVAFGSSEASPHYSAAADLDNDGFVDGMDLALLAASFGLSIP